MHTSEAQPGIHSPFPMAGDVQPALGELGSSTQTGDLRRQTPIVPPIHLLPQLYLLSMTSCGLE